MQQPGGYHPRANAPPGRYGNGGGFRFGGAQGQPHRPPAPPEKQMTPRQREQQVLMAAGRLAAEFLVDRGDLPPDVLDNRPPAPIPFQQQQQGPPAARAAFRSSQGRPPPQQHRHLAGPPRAIHFQFQGHQQWRRFPGPRPFQAGRGHGPFPKRPRQGPPRSFPYGPHPNKKTWTWYAGQGQGAAAPVAESEMQEDERQEMAGDEGNVAVAGEASGSPPTAKPGGAGASPTRGQQQVNEQSGSSLGANDTSQSS